MKSDGWNTVRQSDEKLKAEKKRLTKELPASAGGKQFDRHQSASTAKIADPRVATGRLSMQWSTPATTDGFTSRKRKAKLETETGAAKIASNEYDKFFLQCKRLNEILVPGDGRRYGRYWR